MSLSRFLNQLFTDGRVILQSETMPNPAEVADAMESVREFEISYRDSLPADPPGLDPGAISWGITQFYRITQQIAYKHLNLTGHKRIKSPPRTVEACYSVDLVFRFLPDVLRLCRGTGAAEDVSEQLMIWAHEWPLSSVGIPLQREFSIDSFIGHPCLRMMYVDRIFAQRDTGRLNDDRVKEAVRCALGAHSHLAPEFAACLTEMESTSR